MSEAKPIGPGWSQPAPARKSSGLKWVLVGCGGIFVIGLLICAGFGIFGYQFVNKMITEATAEFEAKGYERQTAQVIEVSQSPKAKTIYVCQVLKINKDVDVDWRVRTSNDDLFT